MRAEPLPTNLGEAIFEHVPTPLLEPAPRQAEHTREIARDVLGFSDARIDDLLTAGVLQLHPAVAALQPA
jgi:crotonobetainyl-CoA:carnitine CoA-transferase CaiB-like acyl-CoA transferase